MNANHGKIVLALIIFASWLFAAVDYKYELHLSKRSVYLKSPLIVTFDINQTDHSKVMYFDFNIKEEGHFFVHRINKVIDESYHKRKESYTYLVYPLKSGKLVMHFDLLIRRGNDDLLTTAFTGGRYNVKAIETKDKHEPVPTEVINVKPLPFGVKLVGAFNLTRTVEESNVQAFEPLYLTYRIQGIGFALDVERLKLLPKTRGVKIFADKPKITKRYTSDGIRIDAIYRYALMSNKDYVIPELKIKAFDVRKKKNYTIEAAPIDVHIQPVEASLLIDKTEHPAHLKSPLVTIKYFFIYLLIFIAGWLSAIITGKIKDFFGFAKKGDPWKKEVKSAKDAKTLMKLLIHRDAELYARWIDILEENIYRGKNIDLKKIKKDAISL